MDEEHLLIIVAVGLLIVSVAFGIGSNPQAQANTGGLASYQTVNPDGFRGATVFCSQNGYIGSEQQTKTKQYAYMPGSCLSEGALRSWAASTCAKVSLFEPGTASYITQGTVYRIYFVGECARG